MTRLRYVLASAICASLCQAWAATPANLAGDPIYQARFAAMLHGAGEHYAPLESVPGANPTRGLPPARRPAIAASALDAAAAYARANHSSAFLVWHHGMLAREDYFDGSTADTPLVSKSLAKPLGAIAIGRAIQLGAIRSLDEPVSDFITEWRNTPKAAMLVRHLLDMRSGLLGQRMATDPSDILNLVYLSPDHDSLLIHDYPLTHAPGTRFDYANAVGDLVALVIERATGHRYAQFVSEQILKPLGASGGTVWIDRPGGLAHSACCMMLPARSWLRLGILLLDDGKIGSQYLLPKGYVAEMRRATPQNPYYGLGVYGAVPYVAHRGFGNPDTPGPSVFQSAPYLATDLFLFDGNADQVVYIVPSERLVILRMGGAPPKTPAWDNAFLPNTILGGLLHRMPGAAPQPHT